MSLPVTQKYRPAVLLTVVCLFANPGQGNLAPTAPQSFEAWLGDVAFLGEGVISQVTMNAGTGYFSFRVVGVNAWKGSAPKTASFQDWPFGSSVSEGQRVVFLAFTRGVTRNEQLVYVSPMPVVRVGGRECFSFSAGRAILPPSMLVVQWQSPAKERNVLPFVFLKEFRAAVRSAGGKRAA
jgi:hypothetical protein